MLVGEDEAHVAEALVEFMYTGELPALGHDDMLRLMRLSDRFQVKNCPAACARRFADTPMEELSLETVCAIFEWPGFLQEAQPFAGVSSKAWAKLLDVFGDLEAAWQDSARWQQFLGLPIKAVKKLLASDQLAVVSENTVLVALAGWLEAHARSSTSCSSNAAGVPGNVGSSAALGGGGEAAQQHQQQQQQQQQQQPQQQQLQVQQGWGAAANAAQQLQQQQLAHKELAELVRLQHLSPAFLGSVLKRLPVMANVATTEALMAAARYAAANEATRNKLHSMPSRFPRMKVLYAAPRARSAVTRLQFEWVLELAAVKAMIAQFRASKVTVDRYSEPHYFNGFQWQLVLQVLEPPAKPQANSAAAAASASSIDVFVGTTARIAIGSATHLPDVLYFRGQLAAREVVSGDFSFVNRMESGFVCGTAGWGFRNFLRITDWDSEQALRRFFYDGKIHLRCSIDQCE
ncbi:hypothetical protein OEZ86_004475 [Tetradesmus obliquus]|uniref:BACK domain-containing protein n=1 Tax=Tetradesmus obliquus TaxID=3088 RepID=A0ABY8UHI3_TETOB|nr:hypothetical protein OEZ85_004893 [Tetradesmus obliquus]WIA40797.1 hypothetical protein OEZ86_004475 [Tetradesmus obliquus]